MPSKSKEAHPFKIGDSAIVRDVPRQKIVNSGVIVKVTAQTWKLAVLHPEDRDARHASRRTFCTKRCAEEGIFKGSTNPVCIISQNRYGGHQ